MKGLRHPIRAVREPFGTAGLIVAIVALVAAVGGTAFAATKLTSTQKKEVEKIAKKVAKAGPVGPTGPKGDPGAPGAAGGNGTNGAPGENVTIAPASGAECPGVGGTKFSNKTSSGKVCNGKDGETGFTETLPSEKTETGTWGEEANTTSSQPRMITIPFTIPLAAAGPEEAFFLNKTETEEAPTTKPHGCEGTLLEPTAPPGQLCVYTFEEAGANYGTAPEFVLNPEEGEEGFTTVGAFMRFYPNVNGSPGNLVRFGTWAVTAP